MAIFFVVNVNGNFILLALQTKIYIKFKYL
jgi:hypothetical protein